MPPSLDGPRNATRPGNDVNPATVSNQETTELLGRILRDVSRSFYLSLRILPHNLRKPIGIAYLLARAADTIADTPLLEAGQRLDYLLRFRRQLQSYDPDTLQSLGALIEKQVDSGEKKLLQNLERIFFLLENLSPQDAQGVRKVVLTLTQGMELDLRHFPPQSSQKITAFKTADELDDYTYRVAGCVGEFWSDMLIAHTPSLASHSKMDMHDQGVRYGKALQLINILRDLQPDLSMGRCYLPLAQLGQYSLTPEDLLKGNDPSRTHSLLSHYSISILTGFRHAERYVMRLPRHCLRLRLASLWPLLIGLATLDKLMKSEQWPMSSAPIKVERRWVYRMILLSLPAALSNHALAWWIKKLRRPIEQFL